MTEQKKYSFSMEGKAMGMINELSELLKKVMGRHDITVGQLAERAGFAVPTTYEYTRGAHDRGNGMIIHLAALYELTRDHEIIDVLLGKTPYILVEMPKSDRIDVEKLEDALRQLWMLQEKQLTRGRLIAEIFKDGKVDKKDDLKIEELVDTQREIVGMSYEIIESIKALRKACQ